MPWVLLLKKGTREQDKRLNSKVTLDANSSNSWRGPNLYTPWYGIQRLWSSGNTMKKLPILLRCAKYWGFQFNDESRWFVNQMEVHHSESANSLPAFASGIVLLSPVEHQPCIAVSHRDSAKWSLPLFALPRSRGVASTCLNHLEFTATPYWSSSDLKTCPSPSEPLVFRLVIKRVPG